MYAASQQSIDLVKTLIENKADFNAKDNDGKTALNYAAMKSTTAFSNPNDIINMLIAKGAEGKEVIDIGNGLKLLPKIVHSEFKYPFIAGSKDSVIISLNDKISSIISNSNVTMGYDVKFAKNGILSIFMNMMEYSGGTHPNILYKGINIDLKTGMILSLKEMFKPNTDYKKTILDFCAQELKDRGYEESFIKKKLANEFEAWNLTEAGLLMQIYVYRKGDNSIDPVSIPYDLLRNKMKSNYFNRIKSSIKKN